MLIFLIIWNFLAREHNIFPYVMLFWNTGIHKNSKKRRYNRASMASRSIQQVSNLKVEIETQEFMKNISVTIS
jgi:hypothetical protein